MLRARHVCCALLLASCASSSSAPDKGRDDRAGSGKASGDPWKSSDDADKSVGSLDLKAGIGKIAEAITKPGPYEAPDKSKDFDEGKPHWGVLKLDGNIVERQALSLFGGRATELRALLERLRELATDDKLTGLLVRVESIEVSLPDAIELRAAIHDVRKAGKTVACHAENAG